MTTTETSIAASAPGTARPSLRIGPIALRNPVLLAPMSGVTDLPTRRLAWEQGAGLVVTEMVASKELVNERPDVLRRANGRGEISPHVVQLAGCEPSWMAEGARVAQDLGADIIDINMGCPARMVTGKASGSALMRDLEQASRLIEATVGAVRVPVTLKMRLGWDERSLNAPELAVRSESLGVQLITVHGRTRCQFFKGRADWGLIRTVKAAVRIPVIANGDVESVADALAMLSQSGADGIMVGRGAGGSPWLMGRIAARLATGRDPGAPPLAVQGSAALAHYDGLLSHYGHELGRRNARKHLGWYVERRGLRPAAAKAWRAALCAEHDIDTVRARLSRLFTPDAVLTARELAA
jgi:nifR3 family TIM-barrel protein